MLQFRSPQNRRYQIRGALLCVQCCYTSLFLIDIWCLYFIATFMPHNNANVRLIGNNSELEDYFNRITFILVKMCTIFLIFDGNMFCCWYANQMLHVNLIKVLLSPIINASIVAIIVNCRLWTGNIVRIVSSTKKSERIRPKNYTANKKPVKQLKNFDIFATFYLILKKTSNQIGRRKFVLNAHGNQLFGLMMPSFPRLCD